MKTLCAGAVTPYSCSMQSEGHKTVVTKTRKDGVTQRYHIGRKPTAPKPTPQPTRAAASPRNAHIAPKAPDSWLGWFLAARPFPRTTARIAKARAERRAERADARVRSYLNAEPNDLSDRELYAARDHIRKVCAQLDQAATDAETPKQAREALSLGEKMRQRQDLIQGELSTRPAPITRALRLLQGKDASTGRYVKKDRTRKAKDDGGDSFSGAEDKVGGFLTGWFDFIADTLAQIRKS